MGQVNIYMRNDLHAFLKYLSSKKKLSISELIFLSVSLTYGSEYNIFRFDEGLDEGK
jgi:hypothetical protein